MARNNPVLLTGPTRGLDGRGWISKARNPNITDGRIGDMWFNTLTHFGFGPKTAAGWGDGTYLRGPNGWTAKTRVIADGTRRVREIFDWIGGGGTKPATGYEGATGTVPDIADAVDYRGEQGPQALINTLDAKTDVVTYETLTALAESSTDNEKAPVKRVFEPGGSMAFVAKSAAQATNIPSAVKRAVVDGRTYRRSPSEPTIDIKYRSEDRYTDEGVHDSANGGWWVGDEPLVARSAAGGDSAAARRAAVAIKGLYLDDGDDTPVARLWAGAFAVPDKAFAAGATLASDGHANWMRLQSGLNYNPIELVLYGAQGQGFASCAAGGNTITRISGSPFTSAWVGKEFYYFNKKRYRVASVVDVNTLTVQEVGGGAVTFPSSVTRATFHYVVTSGDGTCDVNGTAVTRKSGQPFIPFGSTINIAGVAYTYSFIDDDHITLGSSGGVQPGVAYRYEINVNNQISTIRVQKYLGSDEENLTIAASALGFYYMNSQINGDGFYYPIFLGSGQYSPGDLRRQIGIQPNGDLTLGGDYGSDALRILAGTPGASVNPFVIAPATTGFAPTLRSISGTDDADVGMNFDTLGSGGYRFTGNSFGGVLFEISGALSATSYLGAFGSTADSPGIQARGEAANLDLALSTKGSGKVRFGTFTAGSDAAITGYITIKDANGTERKLATIA